MNVVDFATNFTIMASDMAAMVARLQLDPAVLEPSGAVPWIIIDFLFGFLLVFTYAAMRPRFGPGAKTAVIAGLGPWLAVTFVLYGFAAIGIFEMGMFLKGSACALVSTLVGSVAGAAVYKE